MKIIEVTHLLREQYQEQLKEFEKLFTYPLGNDRFSIDHGDNYFSFFDRLGIPYIFLGILSDQVIAVAIAVLRNIEGEPIWYICDLKVHPSYRGTPFTYALFDYAFHKYSSISEKIYGISMNSRQGNNPVARLARRIPYLKLSLCETLLFYTINNKNLLEIKSLIMDVIGYCTFISLQGQKDLILSSTKEPLSLLHFSYSGQEHYPPSSQYMFCFPELHPSNNIFKKLGIQPSASASIISNMKEMNWSFVESSDI
jgi:hypothetical protein